MCVVQDGFNDFVTRCEGAEFEDASMAHQGKMSHRDLLKMKQNPGLLFATKPASELAMDNRDTWEVCLICYISTAVLVKTIIRFYAFR